MKPWHLHLAELAVVGALVATSAFFSPAPTRPYWPVTPAALRTTTHTHVAVTGVVTLVRHEDDGDLHIRIAGPRDTIVAECIPKLPCRMPRVGDTVTVRGISRRDPEHGWYEVHPVEEGP